MRRFEMRRFFFRISMVLIVLTVTPTFLISCKAQESREHSYDKSNKEEHSKSEGEGHDSDNKEGHDESEKRGHDNDNKEGHDKSEGEGSEESGTEYDLSYRYNVTKHGVKLTLAYDKASNSFKGVVKNVSSELADRVRVEVHLSNGTELGPTTPVDLKPNESKSITIRATESKFKGWSTHAEVGNREHGAEGEEHR